MDEDVNVAEGTGGGIGVEVGDEGPAFEDEEGEFLILKGGEEDG